MSLQSLRAGAQISRTQGFQSEQVQERGNKKIQAPQGRGRMSEQCPRPGFQRRKRLTAIEQITCVHSMSRGPGASFHAGNCIGQPGLTPGPIQNAESFAPEFGSLGPVLRCGVITRRGPCLRNVQNPAVLSDSNPEVMVEQKVKSRVEPARFFQDCAPKENTRLADDLKTQEILRS